MRVGFSGFLVGLFALTLVSLSQAQAPEAPAAGSGVIIVFPTGPEASLKMKSGNHVRGKLISLSELEAVIDTGRLSARDRERGLRGNHIGSDRYESLKTTNGQLTYTPDKDDFATIIETVRAKFATAQLARDPDSAGGGNPELPLPGSVPGSGIPGAQPPVDLAPKPSMEKPKPVKNSKPAPNLGNGGFGGLENVPKKATTEADPAEAETEDPAMASPGASVVTYTCLACNKMVTAADQRNGICPHCGITWVDHNPHSATPGSGIPGAGIPGANGGLAHAPAGMNPPPAAPGFPGGQLPGGVAPQQAGPGQVAAAQAAPLGPGQGGVQAAQGGFTIESVPGWAKAVVFIALLLAAYHFFLNK